MGALDVGVNKPPGLLDCADRTQTLDREQHLIVQVLVLELFVVVHSQLQVLVVAQLTAVGGRVVLL